MKNNKEKKLSVIGMLWNKTLGKHDIYTFKELKTARTREWGRVLLAGLAKDGIIKQTCKSGLPELTELGLSMSNENFREIICKVFDREIPAKTYPVLMPKMQDERSQWMDFLGSFIHADSEFHPHVKFTTKDGVRYLKKRLSTEKKVLYCNLDAKGQ